jgi:V-type H+-transporting ATPase subunit d
MIFEFFNCLNLYFLYYFTFFLNIDDFMFEELTKRFSLAFEQQFHFACFYAYIRIKEQEIKNIIWLVELISLEKSKDSAQSKLKKNYILPFNY